jgi:Tfp pilus assembly pilus retraction ATPase PilT
VISQKLVRTADGQRRIAALEIMVVTPTIQKYIEEARISQMYDAVGEGEFWGMQTMNQVLDRYFKQGLISEETALANAGNLTELRQMLRRQA